MPARLVYAKFCMKKGGSEWTLNAANERGREIIKNAVDKGKVPSPSRKGTREKRSFLCAQEKKDGKMT